MAQRPEGTGRNPGRIPRRVGTRSPSGPACSTWPQRGPGCGRGSTGPAPPPPSGPRSPAGSPPGSSCKDRRNSVRADAPRAPRVRARPDCGSNNPPSPGRDGSRGGRSPCGEARETGLRGRGTGWSDPQLGAHSSGLGRGEPERSPRLGVVRREDVGTALRFLSSRKNADVGSILKTRARGASPQERALSKRVPDTGDTPALLDPAARRPPLPSLPSGPGPSLHQPGQESPGRPGQSPALCAGHIPKALGPLTLK